MKKNLLFNLSNFRAVALCLAFGCSTLAGWAIGVGDTFTENGVSYKVVSFGGNGGIIKNKVEVASQTLTGEVKIPGSVRYEEGSDVYSFDVTSFDLSQMTISRNLTSLIVENAGYSVAIPEECFLDKSELKTVIFSGNVNSIGDMAFEYCYALTNVSFGENSTFTEIPENAFYDCEGLSTITIPNSVTSIGGGAFWCCKSLPAITIPNRVTSIGGGAFEYCSSLSTITIPDGVTSIGRGAFSSAGLTKIIVPEGVTSIAESTFSYCLSLADVTIPSSVTSIGGAAFYHCSSLSTITIPEGVESIEKNTFLQCTALKSVTIPASVTSIGESAFADCSLLETVTCLGTTPPECASTTFNNVDLAKCAVLVPDDCETAYMSDSVWGKFGKVSGVEDVTVDDNAVEVARYNVNGVKLSAPQKGINIIKMSDGSVKKVVVAE